MPPPSPDLVLTELDPLGPQYPRGIRTDRLELHWLDGTDGRRVRLHAEPGIGTFECVHGDAAAARSAAATARGALVVVSANTAPGQDADFASWYDHTHLPDVLAAGRYRSATRYAGQLACGGPRRSLALYLTDEDPLEAHGRVQAAFGSMTMWPAIDVHHVRDYAVVPVPAARR